jgi:hypothetical protein
MPVRPLGILWIPLFLALLVLAVGATLNAKTLMSGGFIGVDDYTRVVQVIDMYEAGDWHQSIMPGGNAPFGESRTWTRSYDALLLAGGYALGVFSDFRSGLHLWAVIVSPVLFLATILALYWAASPLLPKRALFFLGLTVLVQPNVIVQFMAGRPDHHAIQAFLFVVLIGFAIRAVGGDGNGRAAFWAGFVAAFSLWTSLEALVVVAVVIAAFAVLWYWKDRTFLPTALIFSAALTFFCLAANIIERPQGEWLHDEYDRLSIAQIMLFSFVLLFWLAISAASRFGIAMGGPGRRAIILIAGAAIGLAALALSYPKLLDGPMAEVPREIYVFWHTEIAAHRPTFPPGDLLAGVRNSLFFMGPALVAAVYLPFVVTRTRVDERPRWLFMAVAMAVFVPIGFYQLRWNIYAELLGLPIYALLLDRVLEWSTARRFLSDRPVTVAVMRGGLIIIFVTGFVAIGAALGLSSTKAKPTQQGSVCDVAAVSRYLAESERFGGRPRNILTLISIGPQLLYRTPHRVVATPDHRNPDGIIDALRFLTATNTEQAKAIVQRRQLDLVMICPGSPEDRLFRGKDEQTLFDRLVAGQTPSWLAEVPFEAGSIGGYRLFEVEPRFLR